MHKTCVQAPYAAGINAGAVYAQGCHPAGPVAWMAAEVADRVRGWVAWDGVQ